jgi:hypothetical protein
MNPAPAQDPWDYGGMRISISHNRGKEQVVQSVDKAFADAMRALPIASVEVTDVQKSWSGSTLTFSLNAKVGFLKNRIHGTIEVTETDLIVNADLGVLENLLPKEKVRAALESRVRGLLG